MNLARVYTKEIAHSSFIYGLVDLSPLRGVIDRVHLCYNIKLWRNLYVVTQFLVGCLQFRGELVLSLLFCVEWADDCSPNPHKVPHKGRPATTRDKISIEPFGRFKLNHDAPFNAFVTVH